MDVAGGDWDAESFTELRNLERELRELLWDLRTQQETRLEERQETWETWLDERFGDTQHAEAIRNAEISEEYPTTSHLKRAFSSLLGFEPEFPAECEALTDEIERLSEVRAEARQRLHQLYRDILTEQTENQDTLTTVAIENPSPETELIHARFRDDTHQVELSVTVGADPAADRVQGHLQPHTATDAPPQPPTLRSDHQTDETQLPLAVAGTLPAGCLSFTVAGRFLASLPVIYALMQLPDLVNSDGSVAGRLETD